MIIKNVHNLRTKKPVLPNGGYGKKFKNQLVTLSHAQKFKKCITCRYIRNIVKYTNENNQSRMCIKYVVTRQCCQT